MLYRNLSSRRQSFYANLGHGAGHMMRLVMETVDLRWLGFQCPFKIERKSDGEIRAVKSKSYTAQICAVYKL